MIMNQIATEIKLIEMWKALNDSPQIKEQESETEDAISTRKLTREDF